MKIYGLLKKELFSLALFLFTIGMMFCVPVQASAAKSVSLSKAKAVNSSYLETKVIFRDDQGKTRRNAVRIDSSMTGFSEYKLGKKYTVFSGTLLTGEDTGSGVRGKVEIYVGNKLKYSTEVAKGEEPQPFQVNVSGAKKMTIRTSQLGSFSNGFIFIAGGKLHSGPCLNKESMSLMMGKKSTLKILGTKAGASWKSSNEKVASVSSNGVVNAVFPGNANITARVKGRNYTCKVKVKNTSPEIQNLEFKTDGGAFIKDSSSATVEFSLSAACANVSVSVKSADGSNVYTQKYTMCDAGTPYTLIWEGVDASGRSVGEGTYIAEVKAGETTAASAELVVVGSDFDGGDGSADHPFLVSTLEQLQAVERYNGYSFLQTEDIDGGLTTFNGLFSDGNPFTGTYDGNGHSIKNFFLQDDAKDALAMFVAVGEGGTVKNVALDNIYVTARKYGAVLVYNNYGTVSGCTVENCNANIQNNRGAILAYYNGADGLVTGCKVLNCTMSNSGFAENMLVAGVFLGFNDGKMLDCSAESITINTAKEVNSNDIYIGGICASNKGNVMNCTVTDTDIQCVGPEHFTTLLGGVAAVNEGYISKSYYIGSITCNDNECTKGIADQKGTFIE